MSKQRYIYHIICFGFDYGLNISMCYLLLENSYELHIFKECVWFIELRSDMIVYKERTVFVNAIGCIGCI